MGEALLNNLGGIFTGAALFVTALGTLLNIWFTHRTRAAIAETKAEVVAVKKSVDDGAKEVQRVVNDIAKTAVAATAAPPAPRAVRASDVKAEP